MEAKTQIDLLLLKINILEAKQAMELQQLKDQIKTNIDHINPLSFLTKSIATSFNSPEIKTDIVSSAINLTSHFLSKHTILGLFQKPIKKIVSNALLFVINKANHKSVQKV